MSALIAALLVGLLLLWLKDGGHLLGILLLLFWALFYPVSVLVDSLRQLRCHTPPQDAVS